MDQQGLRRRGCRTEIDWRCDLWPARRSEDLDRILTLCERRTLSKNLTLSYNNVIYQIKTKRAGYTMRQAQVEVRERHTGEITIEYKQRPLAYTIYQKQEPQQGKVIEAKQERGPVPSHPWRRFYFSENSMQAKERRGELCLLPK